MTRALSLCPCLAATIAAAFGVTGCQASSSPSSYTPITGIEILPSSLLQGLKCGTGNDDVYRYVAVVWDAVDGGRVQRPIASSVFDCFTAGVFENLPASDAGSQQYLLEIFAYSRASLPLDFTCPGGFSLNGGVCPALDASPSETGHAQWTTTCSATQQQGIPVLAVCQPLTPLTPLAADAGAPGD